MRQSLIRQPFRRFMYVTSHSPTLPPLYLRRSSFYNRYVDSPTSQTLHLRYNSFSNSSVASHTSQLIIQSFFHFSYVTDSSLTSPGEPPMYRGMKKQPMVDQLVTKFRSSYSFGQLLRILLRAVCSDSSFNNHSALYFVKYPSRAAQNSPEGRRRPAGRGLKTPALGPHKKYIFTGLMKNP